MNLINKGTFTALIQFPRYFANGYLEDIDVDTIQCNGAHELTFTGADPPQSRSSMTEAGQIISN
ncbi:MAG: hypothetical protein JW932_06900 [Deltaproteobacteria bacterium]|nr:hypothetical protein [Deltaproteobacteria bacterium]